MLERVPACLEPTSQVFLHRFEAPYRSQRLLSPDFFKNGLQTADSAPWWPSFLASIRSVPQAARPTRPQPTLELLPIPRKQPLHRRQKRPYSNRTAVKPPARAYSRTAVTKQDTESSDQPETYEPQDSSHFRQIEYADPDSYHAAHHLFSGIETDVAAQHDHIEHDSAPFAESPSEAAEAGNNEVRYETQLLSPAQQRIEQLLQFESTESPEAEKPPAQEIWELFITLPDQGPYASAVMQFLAASSHIEDLNHALSAYAIIPSEDRTQSDYSAAADVAVRRRRYPLVLQVCKEAISNNLGVTCRQTALLALLRAGVYKSAVRLWDDCWGDAALHRYDWKRGRRTIPHVDLKVIDDCEDLPKIFFKTVERMKRGDALLSDADRQSLLRISCGLAWRICDSGKAMGAVTLNALLTMFEHLRSVQSLSDMHILHAIRTVCSSRVPRMRNGLANALYQEFLERHPDKAVPKHILHGLLYLANKAGESREAIEYLLGQFKEKPVDWTPHPHQLCPGKDEYVLALRTLAWQGDIEGVNALYSRFVIDHGLPKTLAEITPSLYVHAILGDVPETRKAFEDIQSKWSFEPETVCWTIVMYAHARSAEPHRSFDVLDEMLQQNLQPDFYTYGILGSVCSDVGDESSLLTLLEMAAKQGIRNIASLLSSLVEVYLLNGDVVKAENLLTNLPRYKLETSPVRIWNIVLRYHAYQSDPSDVVRIQEQMKQAHVKPDEMTYATMMAALIQKSRTREALRILRSLHLKSAISATPFLYSLIMNGFQREKNRDMVNVIWKEMQGRFPAPTPSAKLAMLRSEQERGLAKTRHQILRWRRKMRVDLKDALEFLEQNGNYLASEKANKSPQPGFERRQVHEAVPSIYTETVSEALAMYGKPIQAGKLMDRYDGSQPIHEQSQSIRSLTTRMLVATRQYQHAEVDDLWAQILQIAIKTSISPLKLRQVSLVIETKPENPVAYMEELISKLRDTEISVLPARRLALALPLSRYMIALGDQGRHSVLIPVVELFLELGFTLTGQNWNTYVKTLCNSPDPEHLLLAFAIFERVLLPHMPPLRVLVKGLFSEPHIPGSEVIKEPAQDNPVNRRDVERKDPTRPIPTYETTVWLASVLRDARQWVNKSEGPAAGLLRLIENRHPEMLKRIREVPFRSDRIQRVLLHRKGPVYGSRHAFENRTSGGPGITTARSVIDQLPVQSVDWVTRTLQNRNDQDPNRIAESILLAEQALGEIVRNPLWLNDDRRWESYEEVNRRVQRTELEYLELVEQMERDIKSSPLAMNDESGDPAYRPDWSALAGNKLTPQSSADSSVSLSIDPDGNSTEVVESTADSKLYPDVKVYKGSDFTKSSDLATKLDRQATLESRANLQATRKTIPMLRIKNRLALFNPLLPPRPEAPLQSWIDHNFELAKARRRPRILELQALQAQQGAEERELVSRPLETAPASAEEGEVEFGASTVAYTRIREERLLREQEQREMDREVNRLRKEQQRRVSGYLSATVGLGAVRPSWPATLPLGPGRQSMSAPSKDPTADDVPWDSFAGVPVKEKRVSKKKKERLPRAPRPPRAVDDDLEAHLVADVPRDAASSLSLFGLNESTDRGDDGDADHADDADGVEVEAPKKGPAFAKLSKGNLEYQFRKRAAAKAGNGVGVGAKGDEAEDKKGGKQGRKKSAKDANKAAEGQKPFGAWDQGGDGFIGF